MTKRRWSLRRKAKQPRWHSLDEQSLDGRSLDGRSLDERSLDERSRTEPAHENEHISTGVLDINALAKAIDPAKLDEAQFVQLIDTLDMLGSVGTGISLTAMSTEAFIGFISGASRPQLEALMAHQHLRQVVFSELFRRMGDHLDTERARSMRAVVHWRFSGGSGEDGFDRFQTIIANGTCVSADYPSEDPRVTLTLSPVELLRVLTGAVSLPMLFISGKVKVKGDIGFAAGLVGYFDLPKP